MGTVDRSQADNPVSPYGRIESWTEVKAVEGDVVHAVPTHVS